MTKTKLARRAAILASVALALAAILSACGAGQSIPTNTPPPQPTATQPPPTATTNPLPSGEGECTLVTDGATSIYYRPSREARVFIDAGSGFEVVLSGRTADGWLGFNPGMAQAANIGPFRLRWIHMEDVSLSGNCVALNEVWPPLPGVCYTMPMDRVEVHQSPSLDSDLVAWLDAAEFAAVLGVVGDNWAQVDFSPGNTGLDFVGWVERSTLNLNGACELPELGD